MNKTKKLLSVLAISVFVLVGCTVMSKPSEVQIPKAQPIIQPIIQQAKPVQKIERELKIDYSSWGMFALYMVSLVAACIYFKYTGRRMQDVEIAMTTVAPKLSPLAKVLGGFAKLLGLIYCKKK